MGGLFSGPNIPPPPPPAPGANIPTYANAQTMSVIARAANVRNAEGTDLTSGVRPTSDVTKPAIAALDLTQRGQPGGAGAAGAVGAAGAAATATGGLGKA